MQKVHLTFIWAVMPFCIWVSLPYFTCFKIIIMFPKYFVCFKYLQKVFAILLNFVFIDFKAFDMRMVKVKNKIGGKIIGNNTHNIWSFGWQIVMYDVFSWNHEYSHFWFHFNLVVFKILNKSTKYIFTQLSKNNFMKIQNSN